MIPNKENFVIKKVVTFIIIFVSIFIFSVQSFAHPGRTDSRGGHYDRSTGEYHYHTGEYAGREQSSSSYSTKEYETYDPDIWQERGLDDGLRQLCEDTMYKNSFKEGFNDAAEEYFKFRPVIKFVFENDSRDIFLINFYDFDKKYNSVRLNSFEKYDYSFYLPPWKTYKEYYDYSYENGSVANAPIDYKYSAETAAIIKKANTDGYNYFYDSCIYAYKENYPVESFFTTLPLIHIFIVIAFIFATVLFLRWAIKSNKNKLQKPNENLSYLSLNDANILLSKIKNIFNNSTVYLLPESATSLICPIGEEIKEIFIWKYSGKPISSFIKLPPSIKYIDKNGHIIYNDSHSKYGDYSVYVSYSGKVLHKSVFCSNAYKELNYLCLPEKYKDFRRCQRCFDISAYLQLKNIEWLTIYKKIVLRKKEYGLDEMNLSDDELLLLSYQENENNKNPKPQYQSLIPEFIPTNTAKPKKPKTEIPTHEYISQKQYDIFKRRFFIIGETIAEGTYFFSKINESEPAYFSSKTEDTPITRNKQRFFLVKGEKIFLFNCKLEPEE